MDISFSDIDSLAAYHLLTQTVVPRPVAWILSRDEQKAFNLAPFSYFNLLNSDPPLMMVSIGRRSNGVSKDTRLNIEATKNFVLHIAHTELAASVTKSSLPLERGDSEVDLCGLKLVPFHDGFDRLAAAKIAFYCEYDQTIEVGNKNQGVILARIKRAYIDDSIVEKKGDRLLVDAQKLSPIGRLGGNNYCTIGEVITVDRPPYTP